MYRSYLFKLSWVIQKSHRPFFCLFRNDRSGGYQRTRIPFRDYKNIMKNDNQCKHNGVFKQVCSDFGWDSIDLDEGSRKLAECIIFSADKFARMKVLC